MKTLFASITLALVVLSAQAKDVIIDVRSPQEFAAGHVEGAFNI